MKETTVNRKRVLIVDDDPNVILFVQDYLEFWGYEIITAENGREALEILAGDLPDLIISDDMMPEMNGCEFVKNIRKGERTREIPFVFLGSKSLKQDMDKGINLGADAYMSKPFDPEELVAQIQALLNQATPVEAFPVPFDVHLTQTELKVLQFVARGLANRDIAKELKSNQRTVESHVLNMFGKTGLINRTELARWAIENQMG